MSNTNSPESFSHAFPGQQEVLDHQTFNAKAMVERHTYYSMGGPENGEYGYMDWEGALTEIFDKHALHKQPEVLQARETLAQYTSVNVAGQSVVDTEGMVNAIFVRPDKKNEVSNANESSEKSFVSPYTTIMSASSDPTSIAHSIAELDGRGQAIVVKGLWQSVESAAITHERIEPQVHREALSPSGAVDPSTLTVLGMAAVMRGGKGKWGAFKERLIGLNDKARAYELHKKEQLVGYYHTDDKEKNSNRKVGTAALVGLAAAAVLFGLGYCISTQDRESAPVPTPSTAPEKPGIDDNNSGKDVQTPKSQEKNDEKTPTSTELKMGGTVWGTAHELLEARGYNHGNPNTAAITNAMRHEMGISEAQARYLAIGTEVPLFDDDEIEDILDNFSNTTPKKIKK